MGLTMGRTMRRCGYAKWHREWSGNRRTRRLMEIEETLRVPQKIDDSAPAALAPAVIDDPHTTDRPTHSSHKGLYWLAVLVFLALAAAGIYLYTQPKTGGQAPTAGGRGGGRGGRGFGVVPVTAAQAKRGDIGVYISNI